MNFEISESAKRWLIHRCVVDGNSIDNSISEFNKLKNNRYFPKELILKNEIITKIQAVKFIDGLINDSNERQKWIPKDANNRIKYPEWFIRDHGIPKTEKPFYGIDSFKEPELTNVLHEAINIKCLKKSPQINRDDFSTRLSLKLLSQKFST